MPTSITTSQHTMKTLVVLSALVALTIAAPTTPDNENVPQLQVNSLPISSTPEKKSALPEDVTSVAQPDNAQPSSDGNTPEARTIGLKKKLVLKKAHGYHRFRDSSEEKDSKECTKEVKVKYCEEEHTAHPSDIKGITTEDIAEPISETDIKQNIQKAKDVVDNLQKITEKNAKSAKDTELHEDFEMARKALSNIQQNFEKLESLELRVATLSEADAVEVAKSKSEEERMAQWKEAFKNAQKSAEIVKNVENSFKSSESQSIVQEINSSKKLDSANLVKVHDFDKHSEAKSSKNDLPHTAAEDMASAASELKVSITEPENHKEPQITNQPKKSKSSELDVTSDNSLMLKSTNENDVATMKSAKAIMKSVPEFEAVSEHDHQIKAAANNPAILKQAQSETHENMKKSADMQKLEENAPQAKTVENMMPIMKAAENIEKGQVSKETMMTANENKMDFSKMIKAAKSEMDGDFDSQLTMKSASQQKDNVDTLVSKTKSADTVSVQKFEPSNLHVQEMSHSPAMKSASPQLGFHHGLGVNTFHSHSHQVSNSHHLGHHISHLGHPGIFKEADMDGAQTTLQMNMKEADEKSAMEQSKRQWNQNQKSALEKNMQEWKSKHTEAMERGAYGAYGAALPAYGAASSGAIGGAGSVAFGGSGSGGVGAVFPGAKHSSCAIPLLLSCSPSVVSGSLKSHSYGAPAYRSDGSNFHKKREIKKSNEIPVTKVKRTLDKNSKTSSTKIQL